MVSKEMYELGAKSSVIREIFEFGKKRAAEIGRENVFDYSLGNPSVPAPESVNEAIRELTLAMDSCELHGYTSAVGDNETRQAIAENLNERFGTCFSMKNLYMTAGAAASLCITFCAIAGKDDEIIIFAPYFPEYKVFISSAGATPVEVRCNADTLQIDLEAFEKAITKNTKAVVVNSPNNPSGAVFSQSTIEKLAVILNAAQEKYGKDIFIIADEPYRELVYGGVTVPYLTKYYDDTIVTYSYSKSLSLPGERIGYALVSPTMTDFTAVYQAVCGSARALGFVCAPSLLQRLVAASLGKTADTSVYDRNRRLLSEALTSYGYTVVKPDGAFYLFVKAMCPDANEFCEAAKEFELLLVPSDDFGCPGFLRISYCVKTEQIEKALPAFKALAEKYGK